jgi:hypothetical protein
MGLRCTFLAVPDAVVEALQRGELPSVEAVDELEIEKTWHALHYLISGSVKGGDEPARLILNGMQIPQTSDHVVSHRGTDVAAFAHVVTSLASKALEERFNPAKMNELKIYPGEWGCGDLEYAIQFWPALKEFFARNAALGHGMVVTIV